MALPHSTDCGEGLSQVRPHCEGQTAKTEGLGASCSRGGGPPVTPVPAPQQPPRRHLGPAAPTLPGGAPSPSPPYLQSFLPSFPGGEYPPISLFSVPASPVVSGVA